MPPARVHNLYHCDPRRVRSRIVAADAGTPVAEYGPLLNLDPTTAHVEYRACATYANSHHTPIDEAPSQVSALLVEAVRSGRAHNERGFHELCVDSHLLVLSPDGRSVLEYALLNPLAPPAPTAPATFTLSTTAGTTAGTDPAGVAAADVRSAARPTPTPGVAMPTESAICALSAGKNVVSLTFDSAVLTWAGTAPGQSHTKLAWQIRGSVGTAAKERTIAEGRDGTHVATDGVWRAILSPCATKVLFAARVVPLDVACDDPDRIPSEELSDRLTSDDVDNIVITPAILTAAGPAPGQSLDDLAVELLDAVDVALEDGNVTVGFHGRHQLYGDGWLLVLSPAGTHMVTARRSST